MKETEYFVLLQMSVVVTEEYNVTAALIIECINYKKYKYNVTVNGDELTGTTEYLTL